MDRAFFPLFSRRVWGCLGITAAVGYDKIIYPFFWLFCLFPVNYSYPHTIIDSTFSSSMC